MVAAWIEVLIIEKTLFAATCSFIRTSSQVAEEVPSHFLFRILIAVVFSIQEELTLYSANIVLVIVL